MMNKTRNTFQGFELYYEGWVLSRPFIVSVSFLPPISLRALSKGLLIFCTEKGSRQGKYSQFGQGRLSIISILLAPPDTIKHRSSLKVLEFKRRSSPWLYSFTPDHWHDSQRFYSLHSDSLCLCALIKSLGDMTLYWLKVKRGGSKIFILETVRRFM